MRILVIPVRDVDSGINKYRLIDPHVRLQNLFPKDYYVEFGVDSDILNTQKVLTFDALFYHAALEQVDVIVQQTEVLKTLGVKIILDIDDYWDYHPSHPYYHLGKHIKLKEKTVKGVRKANMVITTTQHFADKIKKINPNVFVVPNSIDVNEKQFQIVEDKHDKVHVGYVAGVSHLEDIKLLRGVLTSVSKKPVQMQLCGFNVTKETGPTSTWLKMEQAFTDNHNLRDKHFIEYLFQFEDKIPYPYQDDMEYRRVWTKSIHTYMHLYDPLDICLAPLQSFDFNTCKSNLKMLEAGSKKKPIIVSGVEPYLDGVHGKNCLVVEPKKEHKLWVKYVNQLIDSPQMRLDLGESLYEYVTTKFNLDYTTIMRAEVYKKLLK
jgi:glycosyltransferase involved in cell wall biosynthesis